MGPETTSPAPFTPELTEEQIAALPYRTNVGVMLANPSGLVFAAQRLDSTFDAWQMPQGGVDAGENPRDAAIRELQEETGVSPDLVRIEAESEDWLRYDLPHDLVPHIWKGRYRGQEQKWFLMRFLGSDDQINIHTVQPEFSRWMWLAVDDLLDRIVPFKRGVYKAVIAEFQGKL